MASCDFIWQCVKSQVQYFTRKDMLERAGSRPFPTLQKALRIDIDGDPDAPPRRGRATLSSAPKTLGNRGGLPGELLLFRFEFLQRLGAAHTHFLFMSFKTLNKPAAAGLVHVR